MLASPTRSVKRHLKGIFYLPKKASTVWWHKMSVRKDEKRADLGRWKESAEDKKKRNFVAK